MDIEKFDVVIARVQRTTKLDLKSLRGVESLIILPIFPRRILFS